jgi:hypothetical protein
MSDTDTLLNHLEGVSEWEVDYAITVYLEPDKTLPWRTTKKIRECGYKIQDITNGEYQTKITLVRDPSIPKGLLNIVESDEDDTDEVKQTIKEAIRGKSVTWDREGADGG